MNSIELTLPTLPSLEVPPFWRISRWLGAGDMAMDLGTANTLIYIKRRGIVLNEPSIVAVDQDSDKLLAVGNQAKEMFGKTAMSVRCVRPIKDGVVADFDITARMIEYMINKVRHRWSIQRPQIVIGVPSGITQVEKRAVIDAALCAGTGKVMLMEEPMAAALGAGLPVDQAVGNMVVDIGGGTTEVAIICMNGTLYSHSIRVAGDEMDEAIQRHIKRLFGLEIGIFEAERIKLVLGSALPLGRHLSTDASGRDMLNGRPHRLEVDEETVREALQEPISAIVESIVTALEQTKPEMARDIVSRGIYLAGGGALLKGLCERLYRETGVRFLRVHDPLSCVVRGVGQVIDNLKGFRELCIA